jgi:hypothetical protein
MPSLPDMNVSLVFKEQQQTHIHEPWSVQLPQLAGVPPTRSAMIFSAYPERW